MAGAELACRLSDCCRAASERRAPICCALCASAWPPRAAIQPQLLLSINLRVLYLLEYCVLL
eukprot:scaffold267382_cov31-Tisochrysis_lutea.AAC.5